MRVSLVGWLALFLTCCALHMQCVLACKSCLTPPYSETAHTHWVWYHNSNNSQVSARDLVDSYRARGIRVGVVNIDSEWESGFNTFVFNPAKFPDAKQLIDYMHSINVSVTAWITSFINVDAPNYQFAKDNNYLLYPEHEVKWWHGKGSLLNYDNADALKYWHSLMDQVLDLGLDGFKCDASDPYVIEYFDWIGDSWTHYADMYYGDFWNYTRKVRGSDGLLMSRPVDCMPAGSGDFHFSFSPRYAVFSGWVGDQKGTFDGMKVALGNMFESARKKYVNFGSDTGGYLTDPTADKAFGRTKELFLRWTQLSAFCPLFENGGGGEHRPWMFDAETLQVYSHYVDVHYQLIPYLYSTGTAAYYGDRSAMTPMKDVELFYDGFEYLLGDNMLIAPITEANVTSLEVHFPPSKFAHSWVDFWKPTQTYEAGAKVTVDAPLGLVPVFVAAGSIIPMYDTSRAELDHVIVRIFAPTAEGRSFTVHSHGFEVSYTVAVDVLQVQLSERSKDDSVDKAFTVSVCIVGHNGTAERCSAEFDLSYGAVHAIM